MGNCLLHPMVGREAPIKARLHSQPAFNSSTTDCANAAGAFCSGLNWRPGTAHRLRDPKHRGAVLRLERPLASAVPRNSQIILFEVDGVISLAFFYSARTGDGPVMIARVCYRCCGLRLHRHENARMWSADNRVPSPRLCRSTKCRMLARNRNRATSEIWSRSGGKRT